MIGFPGSLRSRLAERCVRKDTVKLPRMLILNGMEQKADSTEICGLHCEKLS